MRVLLLLLSLVACRAASVAKQQTLSRREKQYHELAQNQIQQTEIAAAIQGQKFLQTIQDRIADAIQAGGGNHTEQNHWAELVTALATGVPFDSKTRGIPLMQKSERYCEPIGPDGEKKCEPWSWNIEAEQFQVTDAELTVTQNENAPGRSIKLDLIFHLHKLHIHKLRIGPISLVGQSIKKYATDLASQGLMGKLSSWWNGHNDNEGISRKLTKMTQIPQFEICHIQVKSDCPQGAEHPDGGIHVNAQVRYNPDAKDPKKVYTVDKLELSCKIKEKDGTPLKNQKVFNLSFPDDCSPKKPEDQENAGFFRTMVASAKHLANVAHERVKAATLQHVTDILTADLTTSVTRGKTSLVTIIKDFVSGFLNTYLQDPFQGQTLKELYANGINDDDAMLAHYYMNGHIPLPQCTVLVESCDDLEAVGWIADHAKGEVDFSCNMFFEKNNERNPKKDEKGHEYWISCSQPEKQPKDVTAHGKVKCSRGLKKGFFKRMFTHVSSLWKTTKKSDFYNHGYCDHSELAEPVTYGKGKYFEWSKDKDHVVPGNTAKDFSFSPIGPGIVCGGEAIRFLLYQITSGQTHFDVTLPGSLVKTMTPENRNWKHQLKSTEQQPRFTLFHPQIELTNFQLQQFAFRMHGEFVKQEGKQAKLSIELEFAGLNYNLAKGTPAVAQIADWLAGVKDLNIKHKGAGARVYHFERPSDKGALWRSSGGANEATLLRKGAEYAFDVLMPPEGGFTDKVLTELSTSLHSLHKTIGQKVFGQNQAKQVGRKVKRRSGVPS